MKKLMMIALLGALAAHGEKVKPTLESLQEHFKTPEWLQDAKLGVYTHWGPVTQAIRHHEQGNFGWYARFMAKEGHAAQAYHREHYGDPKEVPYTEIMKSFTAPKFNAEEWAELIAGAGAKFGGPVSIHHDNFAMWDSDIHRWNSMDIGPKRDITGELAKAYRAKGMKFLGAFHHGFTYHYYQFARQPGYQGSDPKFADLYGPVDARDKKDKFVPREFQEQWLALINEYVEKYKPEVLYYDFGLGWQDEDIQYQMYADFYNDCIKRGVEGTVLQKERDELHRTFATMDLERGRMDELTDYTWTTDTSAGPWFYHKNPVWEDSNAMIDTFIDIISKNGIMLLNVAPDYEGSIPPEMQKMLKDFGSFTTMNAEGIYGTRPWPVYGEGRVSASAGHFKIENSKAKKEAKYSAKDIRYTRSKDWKTVYAFLLGWPEEGEVTFHGIAANGQGTVTLLGGEVLEHVINPDKTITVTLPKKKVGDFAHGLKFEGFNPKPHEDGVFYQPNAEHVSADKAAVHGWSIEHGNDLNDEACLHGWSAWWGSSHWLVPAKFKDTTYGLRCRMLNRGSASELRVQVLHDSGEKHEFTLIPPQTGDTPEFVKLGEVELKKDGVYRVVIGAMPDKLEKNAIDLYEVQVAPLAK
jgi:alpha-L-fucosidase